MGEANISWIIGSMLYSQMLSIISKEKKCNIKYSLDLSVILLSKVLYSSSKKIKIITSNLLS